MSFKSGTKYFQKNLPCEKLAFSMWQLLKVSNFQTFSILHLLNKFSEKQNHFSKKWSTAFSVESTKIESSLVRNQC